MTTSCSFTLHLTVRDPMALFSAAVERARADRLDDVSCLMGADGPDVAECLRMLLDPGMSPDGTEILDSSCEFLAV